MHRCESSADLWSIWGEFGADLGSIQVDSGSSWADLEPTSGQYGVDLGSIRGRCWGHLGSIWVDPKLICGRSMVDLSRSGIDLGSIRGQTISARLVGHWKMVAPPPLPSNLLRATDPRPTWSPTPTFAVAHRHPGSSTRAACCAHIAQHRSVARCPFAHAIAERHAEIACARARGAARNVMAAPPYATLLVGRVLGASSLGGSRHEADARGSERSALHLV